MRVSVWLTWQQCSVAGGRGLVAKGEGRRGKRRKGADTAEAGTTSGEGREEQQRFLALLGELPARLRGEQAAWVLNCQAHDIPTLVSSGLLKPLGNPPANGIKYFGTADLIDLTKDRVWLARVTKAVYEHWRRQS